MNAPPKPCAVPRCPSLVTRERPCPVHPPAWGPGRGGSTWSWRIRRAFVLNEQPWCAVGACNRLAVEVDHIVPVAAGGTDEHDNLQPLCRAHHVAKTQRDRARARSRVGGGPA